MSVPTALANTAGAADAERPILEVLKLCKTYRRRQGLFGKASETAALKQTSFDLQRGEILGVVGESGSGKSTLGKIIVGLERADSGDVVLERKVLVGGDARIDIPADQRGIGMIFQDPYSSLNPRMTVRNLVGEGLMIAGNVNRRDIDTRVSDALVLVGLQPGDASRFPHQFSGGQRQRIGIARALVLQPRILVADEAVSSLDVSVQMQVLNLLLDLRDKLDLSLVFITHNIGVVEYLCDRMIVLSRGEIVERGDTRSVIEAPQHDYTQRLLGAVPRL